VGKNLFIGKILSPYGRNGYLKVLPSPFFKEIFFEKKVVWVFVFGDFRKFFVEKFVVKKDFIAVKFKNFSDSGEVDFLKGKEIFVRGDDFAEIENEFFLFSELNKLKVFKGNKFFGKVKDIINLKSNDVLLLEKPDGTEVLIPFVSEFIEKIDADALILRLKADVEF